MTTIDNFEPNRFARSAPLLVFVSGACALLYQTIWLRQLRLFFGASTAATAVVLAVFAIALGTGALLLGPRADRSSTPLVLYGKLELGIAGTAVLALPLLHLAGGAYLSTGGTARLGLGLGTMARLFLTLLVLGPPAFLMGGTLPAILRANTAATDKSRHTAGLLYGLNTLGAALGVFVGTFVLIEGLGHLRALILSATVNAALGLAAWVLGRKPIALPPPTAPEDSSPIALRSTWFLGGAAISGAVFFAMELVWYRLLGPLLGGSVFAFGTILCAALIGIGIGGLLFSSRQRPASPGTLGLSFLTLALTLGFPLCLGDNVAIMAQLLRGLSTYGFPGLVFGWFILCAVMVVPAATVAGYQFPLLLACLGQGSRDLGKQTGRAYALNTAGSALGALAAGLGLMAFVGAESLWRACVALLGGFGFLLCLAHRPLGRAASNVAVATLAVSAVALVLFLGPGPSAAWRSGGIGSGRIDVEQVASPAAREEFLRGARRSTAWQREGVESAIALQQARGYSFVINGKSDGHARDDAPTQIVGGLLGAFLRPAPTTSALVIGLGTGCTAGWLGQIPSVQKVQVIELEPAILKIAEAAAIINHDVLSNPKVSITTGDAREWIQTSGQQFDLIFSEPSNPARAGIANLFSRDFYTSVRQRLAEGGVFLQWVQAYEIDGPTLATIYATLKTSFQSIETWELHTNDLLLVATTQPLAHDVLSLRARMTEEPFATAFARAFRTTELEGVLSHHLARPAFADAIADAELSSGRGVATDDRNSIEFGFARSLGRLDAVVAAELARTARGRAQERPVLTGGKVDWLRVMDAPANFRASEELQPELNPGLPLESRHRATALGHFVAGRFSAAAASWAQQPRPPHEPMEIVAVAAGLAEQGDEGAAALLETKDKLLGPATGKMLTALLRFAQNNFTEAARALGAGFQAHTQDPWPPSAVVVRALSLAIRIAERDSNAGRALFDQLAHPFALRLLDEARLATRIELAARLDFDNLCAEAFAAFEPHFPFREALLTQRQRCYSATKHMRLGAAQDDLRRFRSLAPAHLQIPALP